MNISIKNVDETAFRRLKAAAAEAGISIGAAVTEAIREWSEKKMKISIGIEKIIENAKNDSDIIAVILFGSYARNESDYRDVDVALLLRNKAVDSMQKKAQYSMSDLFDISILNELPLFISSRILEEGKLLYVSNPAALEDFSMKIVREWADFKPWFEESIRAE